MSLIVLKKIIEMFIILLVGVIIYKAKIINDVSTKHLSNVLLLLVSPLLIIQSYQIDFNRELLQGLIWAFAAIFSTELRFLSPWHRNSDATIINKNVRNDAANAHIKPCNSSLLKSI